MTEGKDSEKAEGLAPEEVAAGLRLPLQKECSAQCRAQ